ncbi:transmembrane protein 272-like isoform X1 [Apostichopus japonicus]|uniref:transmembrane protein 272-like isoform X1 n=1 Tax=Stichopus japonicus TaxID=307972 RepID=UPI003AB2990B
MESKGSTENHNLEAGLNSNPPPPQYGSNGEEPLPPPYSDAPRDAPPSYQSLFGQMQDAKQNSSGALDFIQRLIKLLLNTIAVTIFMIILLAVPITMVVIGAIYVDDCPTEKMIPIYLIVSGSCYILKNLIDLFERYKNRDQDDSHGNNPSNALSRLLGCFIFAFFIAGNVWIYRNYPPSTNIESDHYCNPVVYYFAFWITTLAYIFCAFTCLCLCCAALGTAAGAST